MLLTHFNEPGALSWKLAGSFPELRSPASSVRRTSPLEDPHWDSRLRAHPGHSFFHRTAWAKVLAATYRYQPVYLLSGENGGMESVLPMMEVNSVVTGARGVALPFTDYCPPLCHRRTDFQNLFSQAIQFGSERGWKYLEFRGGRDWMGDAPASITYFGHAVDLRGGEGDLFSSLDASARRAVRKAQNSGLQIKISQTLESVRAFYALQCKTRRRHGLPPQSFTLFRNIQEHILARDEGRVFLALHDGIPLAGAVFFHTGGRVIYKYAASDETFQHLRGNNLILWEAIKYYAQRGDQSLHLGRTCPANDGLRRFKLGLGASEEKIEYFKYDLSRNQFVSSPDETTGWHNQVFRALPLFASRLIGAALYRHWA